MRLAVPVAAVATWLAVPWAGAAYLDVDHYTFTPGQGQYNGFGTHFGDYLYLGGSQHLTDGRTGSDNWTLDGDMSLWGQSAYTPGYTWMGWHTVEPTITFYFGKTVHIDEIQIGFNRDEAANIYLPHGVQIGQAGGGLDRTLDYSLSTDAKSATVVGPGWQYTSYGLGGNTYYTENGHSYGVGNRDWLLFQGPFEGSSITISMSHLLNMQGYDPNTQAYWERVHWIFVDEIRFRVPELGASSWLALGGLVALAGWRRRVSRVA